MHLQRLVQIFTQAGLNVRLGSLDPDLSAPRRWNCPTAANWWSSRWCASAHGWG
jgi:hypothetical protein